MLPSDAAIVRELWNRVGVEPVLDGVTNEAVDVARRGGVVSVVNFGSETVTVPVVGTDLFTGHDVESLVPGRFDGALVRLTASEEPGRGRG